MKRHHRIATVIGAACLLVNGMALAEEYDLSEEDVAFIQQLAKVDKLVADLSKASEAMKAFATILKLATPGPAKIALTWEHGTISGWREANKKLVGIHKEKSCFDIQGQAALAGAESRFSAEEFFKQMHKARGCE